MAAASLARHFQHTPLTITLVESPEIGTIGVGEATIPTIRRFYRNLGLSDGQVMMATQATAKLGIAFDGWRAPGEQFIHPFGRFGQDLNGIGFHHYWQRLASMGDTRPLSDYCLPIQLAEANKFTTPAPNPSNSLGVFDWALHLNATAFAKLLKETALQMGVQHVEGNITQVQLESDNGFISALQLADGRQLPGQLFIDCTGFRARLLGEALAVPFESWQDQLLCDRAVVVQSELASPTNPPSFTRARAMRAGWQWRIPLQSRQGNGLVYSSHFLSEDEATAHMLDDCGASPLQEPRHLRFTPGMRKVSWEKNCIALGLAAGFLEPLESTSIALIETAIEKIKLLFPNADCDRAIIDEFNNMTRLEYERVKDFILLHYVLNGRQGEAFWQACREVHQPDTLKNKLSLFKARGHLVKYRWEMFQPASWLALFSGFGFQSDMYDPAADAIPEQQLKSIMDSMAKGIQTAVADSPSHQAFLQHLKQAAGA
ncbi:tryptophan halogenase [Simiduia agarivorans SA1 = DSM 21679]|uniref:Tryptophan halogenase n=2 Tax=Simiduia TaxID=447467 RepID=K4KJB6_SIMAS|nr:tryptophan halogenase [Simiduia agarivorans SA1 = DSM 21679]